MEEGTTPVFRVLVLSPEQLHDLDQVPAFGDFYVREHQPIVTPIG